jgi:aryl-alcohol dehydrogenase-like predicted oxidoreductase
MHRPDPEVPIDETLRALDDLVRAGKVRYIGTSRFAAWQLVEALWQSDALLLNRFISEQPRYNMLDRSIEADVVPVAQKHGIAILSYSPLAGGILTGKYRQGEDPSPKSRFEDPAWGDWASGFMSERAYHLLDLLKDLAAQKECTISQLALAWLIQQPGVTSAIIGPRTLTHFEDNFGALQVEITAKELEKIDQFYG